MTAIMKLIAGFLTTALVFSVISGQVLTKKRNQKEEEENGENFI
ncbi:hypothetical protein [Planomicrobium sp. CPCC 101110]|nr:hypothetical protein [Planomicrobium sp. CPCC 101110]